jgi:diadenylate cyclase
MPDWIPIPGWLDLVDIGLVAAFGWLAISYVRRTRARASLAGLAMLGIVYFVARALDLRLATALLQAFFAVVVLVLVVVFQEDLRRMFEQLGSLRRGKSQPPTGTEPLDLLVRTVTRLASTRTGALIVLPGREPLDRHLEGGILLRGRVSEPLLLSIFDSSSPGHDGAVLLRGRTVERFAVHLPLSANHAALGASGTRHAAALGLSERCDATCIVVSEERGTVSVARGGTIQRLSRPEDLGIVLRSVFEREDDTRRWWQGRTALDGLIATAGALVLWTVFVPGSDIEETTVTARVVVANLPNSMELESTDPGSVEITLRGLRRDLLLAERSDISVRIDAYLAELGRRTFTVNSSDVRKPESLSVVAIAPEKVKLSVAAVTPPGRDQP